MVIFIFHMGRNQKGTKNENNNSNLLGLRGIVHPPSIHLLKIGCSFLKNKTSVGCAQPAPPWDRNIDILAHECSSPYAQVSTLPETNIAPKNGWLEYYFPINRPILRGELSVSGRVFFGKPPQFFSETSQIMAAKSPSNR